MDTPEQFTQADSKRAISCYVAMKQARDEYRVKTEASIEHFQATEEGWR